MTRKADKTARAAGKVVYSRGEVKYIGWIEDYIQELVRRFRLGSAERRRLSSIGYRANKRLRWLQRDHRKKHVKRILTREARILAQERHGYRTSYQSTTVRAVARERGIVYPRKRGRVAPRR